jgi:glutathione synthase/RimK-type ligase-like ATP-grasp enzyme
MKVLVVVNNPKNWPLEIPNAEIVAARQYLADPAFSRIKGVKVFNLCRSYKYQTTGYYVSLLAEARGHKPLPSITTIQDMKTMSIVRLVSEELEEVIQKSLKPIQSREFTLTVYFGRNVAKRYDKLSGMLFRMFHAPMLQALFRFDGEEWMLSSVSPIAGEEIPDTHRDFVNKTMTEYFSKQRFSAPKVSTPANYVAMLWNPNEKDKPSDARAIEFFQAAAKKVGIGLDIISKDDYGSIPEYDALFIRETTNVNHHTYRFARRAQAEGLVVIDDPASILKCSNKVYLAELLEHHGIARPKTVIVHRDNIAASMFQLGFPCILKQPDGSFSGGVFKAENPTDFKRIAIKMLEESSLVIAQEYAPTEFDWRVGILDRKPLFVCKYHMAQGHWQIVKRESDGSEDYGFVDTYKVEDAPKAVVQTALKAANLIGDGFYGVDMKEVGKKLMVIEVNDNPNVDYDIEDAALGEDLYIEIMRFFQRRIEDSRKRVRNGGEK